jgi:hypothetical protein
MMRKMVFLALLLLLAACGAGTPAAVIPAELSVAEYPLTEIPDLESDVLSFDSSVAEDPRTLHTAERAEQFPDIQCTVEGSLGLCTTIGGDDLVAHEDWSDPAAGSVVVTRNGEKIYQVGVGSASPITALRGLWTYDDHWVVETAQFREGQLEGEIWSPAVGQVAVDGASLNDQLGSEAVFGFQTLAGRPFYFFEREGKFDASYDGIDIALGYDEIPHYNCCSASALNPRSHPNLVTYYGRKGEAWYYGEIGVFGQP